MNNMNYNNINYKNITRISIHNHANNLGQKRKSFLEDHNKNLTPKVDKTYILITPKSSLKKNMHLTEELYLDSLLKQPIIDEYEKRANEANSRRTLNFQDNQVTKKISNFNENIFNNLSNGKKTGINNIENNNNNNNFTKNLISKHINISDSSENEADKADKVCFSSKNLKENSVLFEKTDENSVKTSKNINHSNINHSKQDKISNQVKDKNNKVLNFFESYKELNNKEKLNLILKENENFITKKLKDNELKTDNYFDIKKEDNYEENKNISFNDKEKEEEKDNNEKAKNDKEITQKTLKESLKKLNQLEKSISFGFLNNNDEDKDSKSLDYLSEKECKTFNISQEIKSDKNSKKLNIKMQKENNLLLKLSNKNNKALNNSNKKCFIFDCDYIANSDTGKNSDGNKIGKIIGLKKADMNQFSLFDFNSQKSTNNFSTKRKLDINYDSESVNEVISNSQKSLKNKCAEIKFSDYKINKSKK